MTETDAPYLFEISEYENETEFLEEVEKLNDEFLNPKKQLKITIPTFVTLPRKTKKDKKCYLNLNSYRNWCFQVNNIIKQAVKDSLSYLKGTELRTPIKVQFQYFKPTKRITDKSNVDAVARKFVYDALVEHKVIPDDNDDHIKEELMLRTIYDKENPRIEFVFTEIEK